MSTVVEEAAGASEESTRMERNNSSSRIRSVCRSLIQFWRSWIILGVPLVALPLLFQDEDARKEASSASVLRGAVPRSTRSAPAEGVPIVGTVSVGA